MTRAKIIEAKCLICVLQVKLAEHGPIDSKLQSWIDAALESDFDHERIREKLMSEYHDYPIGTA